LDWLICCFFVVVIFESFQLLEAAKRWAKGVPIGSTFFSKDKK